MRRSAIGFMPPTFMEPISSAMTSRTSGIGPRSSRSSYLSRTCSSVSLLYQAVEKSN